MSKALKNPDRWHPLVFPCPPLLLRHHRKPLGWSGRTCPWWSHAGCLESPPWPPCALAHLLGGSVPWSSQAQRWGWQVGSSQGLPFYPFWKGAQCFPFSSHWGLRLTAMTFQISWRVAWQNVTILSRFLVYSSHMKILLTKKEKTPRCNVHSTQVKAGSVPLVSQLWNHCSNISMTSVKIMFFEKSEIV